MSRAVVLGVGNEFRGDDGVGPAVAAVVAGLDLPGVTVRVCDGEPTGLLDAWAGADLAVVVDAVRCAPAEPGRIRRADVDLPSAAVGGASSHALGVPEAVRLGRVLGRLPGELVVLAVEADGLELGAGLSEAVAAAVPRVVESVVRELARIAPQ